MNITEETKQIAKVRGSIYTLLSQCFMQPSKELVNSIIDGSLNDALQATLGLIEDSKVTQHLAELKDFSIKSQKQPSEEFLKELKAEYSRLFVGPGHVLAPPYESVYKTKNEDNKIGIVMGDSTIAVKRFYQSAGLELSDDYKDLPDHITLELHFMGHLCNLELDSAHEGRKEEQESVHKMQVEFLNTHLGNWISDFSQAVSIATNSAFYRGVAKLTETWIEIEIYELE